MIKRIEFFIKNLRLLRNPRKEDSIIPSNKTWDSLIYLIKSNTVVSC